MATVTTFAELQAAVTALDPDITIAENLAFPATIFLNYQTIIRGSSSAITLTRALGFVGPLFAIQPAGIVTLDSLTIDGQGATASPLVTSTGNLTISNSILQNNNATSVGGAVFADIGTTLTCTNSVFTTNSSSAQGGSIFVNANGTATLTDCTVANSTALEGGGIYVNANASMTATGCSILNNTSQQNGAGLFLNTSVVGNITDCTFTGNNAVNGFGGGLFSNNNVSTTLTGSSFVGNHCAVDGGGCYLNGGGIASVANTTFRENSGGGDGGGLYLNQLIGNTSITGCAFESNSSTNGGGLFINGSDTTLTDSSFITNTASQAGGGLFINIDSNFSGNNNIYQGNQAGDGGGGGVFQNANTVAKFSNSSLTNNSTTGGGGGLFINEGATATTTSSLLAQNQSAVGGAIFINNGATLNSSNNTQFIGNTSTGDAGAVQINPTGTFNEQDGTFSGNSAAQTGGAINNLGTLTISGTTSIGVPVNNTAAIAPGIFNGGTLNAQDTTNATSGVFIPSIDNVVQVTQPLLPGSTIQLDQTDYVFPDPAKSPIVVGVPTPQYPVLAQSDADQFAKPVTGFDDWVVRLLNNQVVLVFDPAFRITYLNLMGASNPNPTSYRPEDLPIVLQNPGRVPGFRFVGWFDQAGNQVTVIPAGTTGDLVFIARFVRVAPPYSPQFFARCRQLKRCKCCCRCKCH
ncbi:right-handed parallel beta-helix repeat-containing protein [Shouchella sp. 1P09AA]|uniref:hypothetical protein n=1 Tax=unclassified Shouchella TaxID=2893065 RepID=UPI0039A0A404